jgi:hypothetical protein
MSYSLYMWCSHACCTEFAAQATQFWNSIIRSFLATLEFNRFAMAGRQEMDQEHYSGGVL